MEQPCEAAGRQSSRASEQSGFDYQRLAGCGRADDILAPCAVGCAQSLLQLFGCEREIACEDVALLPFQCFESAVVESVDVLYAEHSPGEIFRLIFKQINIGIGIEARRGKQ